MEANRSDRAGGLSVRPMRARALSQHGLPEMIEVGRRPVLVLWGTIVAERLGFERDEALTLGRAVASLGGHVTNAWADPVTPEKIAEMRARLRPGQTIDVRLVDRVVSVARVPEGLRAVVKNRLIDPASVEQYLGERFGDDIDGVAGAMISLAETLSPSRLAKCAFELYEQFRPETSELDVDRITACIRSDPRDDALANDGRLSESWWEDAQNEMPSFRGPQALIGGATLSHRVEPIRRERTAYHVPARLVDAPGTKTRNRAIEPSALPRSISVSPVARAMLTGATPARRPTSPLVLMLAVILAGAIGGGVSALLVAPPLRTSVMADLRGLLAFYRHMSSAPAEVSEAEPTRSAADSDPSASAPGGEPIAVEISTSLAPAVAIVPASSAEVTRMERADDGPGREPIAVETSPSLPPTTAVVPSSTTVNGTAEYTPLDSHGAAEVAQVEPGDEAAGREPIAIGIWSPLASTTAIVPPSSAASETPADASVDRHDASETIRIAMARGDERMRQGEVVAARRFYEMAAGAGSAEAATAMGRTFDPLYLGRIRVRGAFADAPRAKQWYEKAVKAGDMEALARIELLTWNSSHR